MENWLSMTPYPLLSALIWLLLLFLAMYLARKPFHRSMSALGRLAYNSTRLAASSVKQAEKRLLARNREVLLNAGLKMTERKVELEFDRISTSIQRHLEGYPQIQRKLNEDLLKIEGDFQKSATVSQSLPDWVKVLDAIANIRPIGDRMVIHTLDQIHNTLTEQHKIAAERHRRDMAERHGILSRMVPFWQGVQKTLDGIERAILNLNQRSKTIDRYMSEYEAIRAQTDMAQRQLSASSLTQFLVSGLVLAVAVVGIIFNFNLVALPMSEIMGASNYLGIFRISDVGGWLIVILGIILGIFMMDTLRVTHFFDRIDSLEDGKRRIIFWILFAVLILMAGFESALALVRDRMVADMRDLHQSISGSAIEASELASSSIPKIGQMIMAFILPIFLTFAAIPFESFVGASRTAIGILAGWLLRIVAFTLRLLGNLGFYTGRLIVNIYDLAIFPALWLEGAIGQNISRTKKEKIQTPGVVASEENVSRAEPRAHAKAAIE